MSYHDTVTNVYAKAAETPDATLCCVPLAPLYMPGLDIPEVMHAMNYGCGSTVHPRDMHPDLTVLYVGVGGGLEALQLAYFTRRPGGVIAVDPVAAMREAARKNLELAAATNPWFRPEFVDIRDGDALRLPLEDESVHLAAQNCLFNIFTTADEGGDLEQALREMHRVLKPAGRLVMSDPITTRPMPRHLRDNAELRAKCLSGCVSYETYMQKIIEAGFGSAEVRSRNPYRVLDKATYTLEQDLLLETLEVCAYKVDLPEDGACIFTGKTAIYTGSAEHWDDGAGHHMVRGIPLPVCDKTAGQLERLGRGDIHLTPSTWHYGGGGCC